MRDVAIVLKPSTIISFHRAWVKQIYRWLFTPKRRGKPGPKGPSEEIIAAILEMKRRNPRFGCRRIAQELSFTLSAISMGQRFVDCSAEPLPIPSRCRIASAVITIRELLDQVPFWNARDLERKLVRFRDYYNRERVHASLDGITPDSKIGAPSSGPLSLARFRWKSHCRGLCQLPAAA